MRNNKERKEEEWVEKSTQQKNKKEYASYKRKERK